MLFHILLRAAIFMVIPKIILLKYSLHGVGMIMKVLVKFSYITMSSM